MSAKQRPNLTELRVGIFVLLALTILAVAIFAIGSQVGLFQEQFWAVTYLSNVSGLKPGDVVLLAGVEGGNVDSVAISPPGDLPETAQNRRVLARVSEMQAELDDLVERLRNTETEILESRNAYREAVAEAGLESERAQSARDQLEDAQNQVADLRDQIDDIQEDIDQERSGLQNIEVLMRIKSQYRNWIKQDSSISLGSIGLLGDKYIEISLGRTDEPARVETYPMEGWFGVEMRQVVVITGTQQASFGELITGANDILANFETLSDQVEDIMRSFQAGEGSIGKMLTDPSFYDNLNETVENANLAMERIAELAGNVGEGKGTIPKLLQEDELYNKIIGSTESLEQLLRKLDQGEGTLSRLVNDPEVHDEASRVLSNLGDITDRIKAGEGTLGKLTTEDQLYVSLRESVEELSGILKDIEAGEGTLGKLAKDEELYRNLNEVSSEIVKLLYDFREDPKKFLTIKFTIF